MTKKVLHKMRIIFAKIIDDLRSAIVIDMGNNNIMGGVGIVSRVNNHYKAGVSLMQAAKREGITTSEIDIHWEWVKNVNAEEFERNRLWETAPLIEATPMQKKLQSLKDKLDE